MTCLVEKVAQGHHACCFASEIECQAGGGASKHANDGVQLLAAVLQVGAGDSEVGGVKRRGGGEQEPVLLIPEFVFACLQWRDRDIRRGMRKGARIQASFGNWALGKRCGASHEGEQEQYNCRIDESGKLAPS